MNSEQKADEDVSGNPLGNIIAWQRARSMVRDVYRCSAKMPESERFGLTNQMRRAAVSVPANIAEGYGRGSRNDFLRFLKIARGSLSELQTHIILARDLGMMTSDGPLDMSVAEAARVLQGLIQSLERPGTPETL